MSGKKKKIRSDFRNAVFERDKHKCVMCGRDAFVGNYKFAVLDENVLDAHHITPREEMPHGGYVRENGISLCKDKCHLKAEEYLQGDTLHEGFSPEDLYEKIGSNYEKAYKASERLK